MPKDKLGERLWDVVAEFFTAKRLFAEQYQQYEVTVLAVAKEQGLDRKDLRLTAKAVSKLLDFKKLDHLCEDHLFALKELSHQLFRQPGETDMFDRYVSNIFHEISILKEEHYEVKKYGLAFKKAKEGDEYNQIMDEVHEYFPKRIHRAYNLFQKAQRRICELLPEFRSSRVFIRSLYLFGREALEGAYDGTLEEFYSHLYPGGVAEGYLEVARSFFASGFQDLAEQALSRAHQQVEAGRVSPDQREGLAGKAQELERLLAGARA